MNIDLESATVGSIVTDNINNAKVFQKHNIDFCCGGNKKLTDVVREQKIDLNEVLRDLNAISQQNENAIALDFNQWSLELLIDYAVKFHHHYIRTIGPEIDKLLQKVVEVHAENHKELYKVLALFESSLKDLQEHLEKEEQILFPYIVTMEQAKNDNKELPYFHCGSVEYPIEVMMQEHDGEGTRYKEIATLTNQYTPPVDACNSYKLVLKQLKEFEENLHIHIHVENNILFPKAYKMQQSF